MPRASRMTRTGSNEPSHRQRCRSAGHHHLADAVTASRRLSDTTAMPDASIVRLATEHHTMPSKEPGGRAPYGASNLYEDKNERWHGRVTRDLVPGIGTPSD